MQEPPLDIADSEFLQESILTNGEPASSNGQEYRPVGPEDFEHDTLLEVYRTMLLARRLDGKMLTLLKQGKGHFHIGCSGHEAIQCAIGLLSRPGYDWFCMYYRDLALALSLGQTVEGTLLDHLAKASSPNSGGRQMPAHYGLRDRNMFTVASSVGAQYLPALGLAMAIQQRGEDAFVLCSGGEGATSQGDFHEALNWAARLRAPVLYLIQDNKYAISVPVADQTAGGTTYKLAGGYEGVLRYRVDGTDFFQCYATVRTAIAQLRAGNGPVCLVADVERLLPHSSSDNHLKYRTEEELEAAHEADPILRMEDALKQADVLTEEAADHMRQEVKELLDSVAKWAEAQADPVPETALKHVCFEGDPGLSYGDLGEEGEPIVMVDAINHALHEEMARDESILVYGEDVAGAKGGVFTATRQLTRSFGSSRCFNAPLAEASIVGTAVGLSAAGFKPVIEIQFADYIWPAMQQLRDQVSTLRYRSNNQWSCPMVIRVPCGGYIHGGPSHSQNIESIIGHTPGISVVMPATSADAKGLLKTAIRSRDPVLFLEHKALYRAATARMPEPGPDYLVPFGQARVVQSGADLTMVTYGMMVHKCSAVARQLAREDNVSAEIIDLRSLVPLDSDTILESVRRTNRIMVVHEDHTFLGFGAEVAAQVSELAFAHLDAPVRRVGGAFCHIPYAAVLERTVLPQDDEILQVAREVLSC